MPRQFDFFARSFVDKAFSIITENPVKRLSQTRAWYRVERRQTYIKPHQLAEWYQGVVKLENEVLRDYLLLILFTGLRAKKPQNYGLIRSISKLKLS